MVKQFWIMNASNNNTTIKSPFSRHEFSFKHYPENTNGFYL